MGQIAAVKKYWEIIAGNLSRAGWSWGCVATVDQQRRTIFVVDAHRDSEKRIVVRADEKLTAFVELESAIREFNTNSAIASKHVRSIPVRRHSRA